jgi:hypothetical protein
MIDPTRVMEVVTSPQAVAQHPFFPFLKYNEHWTLYSEKGQKGDPKDRPIRFAARLDACIFSYYRHLLSGPYEALLEQAGLARSVLAYRRIPKLSGRGGCCNIDFALEAVEAIQGYDQCCTVSLDISSFFESLDHERLKAIWCGLIGEERLPADHFAVFRAMTKYHYVEKLEAYERLGYFGVKHTVGKKVIPGYLVPKNKIPTQLCTTAEFREKIAGKGEQPKIIRANDNPHGVPQGAPLSDLLANLYLLDFDKLVSELAASVGGKYFRYSDDILLVVPVSQERALDLEQQVRTAIGRFGKALMIKEKKSAVHEFVRQGKRHVSSVVKPADTNKQFEYLGFRFDGRHMYIRDKTISGLQRKIAQACKIEASRLVRRYRNKSVEQIMALCNFERLYQSFGPVDDFASKSADFKQWTFWTYAKRSIRLLGPIGTPVQRQITGLRKRIETRLRQEVERALRG